MKVSNFFYLLISVGIISLVGIAVTETYAQPPTLWTQTYGGTAFDEGQSVQQTSDGGFIVTGRTSSFGAGGSDVYLVKVNSIGAEQWSQTFGGSDNEYSFCVEQTSDGGYIITGKSNSFGVGSWDYDVYLVKTDASGNEQWSQTFDEHYDDVGNSVQQTSDGGYIIAGYADPGSTSDVFLIKTDATGTEQWRQLINEGDSAEGYDVQQTSDGGYIITGSIYAPVTYTNVYLIKTDAAGNLQWSQSFGGNYTDIGYGVQQTSDGGYIIAGKNFPIVAQDYDVYLIKTDATGVEQWSQTFGGNSDDIGFDVQQTSDDGYIITGYTESYGSGLRDVYLIKTDASGTLDWDEVYGGSNYDEGTSVQQTSDGGYIIGGWTQSNGAGGADVWLIRLDTETPSYPNVTIDLNYVSGSPIGVFGGTLTFDLFVENASGDAQNFDAWLEASWEGEDPTTLVLRSFTNYLSGWTINRPGMYYPIPWDWAAGRYNFTGKVGDNPDIAWDESSFPFTKDDPDFVEGFIPFPVAGAPNPFDEVIKGDSHDNPSKFGMISAFPNPFNPSTVISYQLPVASLVTLAVYDVSGRQIAELVNGWREAGVHEVTFDGAHLSSGIYFYRIEEGEFRAVGKVVLMK